VRLQGFGRRLITGTVGTLGTRLSELGVPWVLSVLGVPWVLSVLGVLTALATAPGRVPKLQRTTCRLQQMCDALWNRIAKQRALPRGPPVGAATVVHSGKIVGS
jgi:hypothetical protein